MGVSRNVGWGEVIVQTKMVAVGDSQCQAEESIFNCINFVSDIVLF